MTYFAFHQFIRSTRDTRLTWSTRLIRATRPTRVLGARVKPEKDDDDVDGGDGDGVKCEEENKWEGVVHEGEKVTCVTTSPTGADTIQKKNIKWHKIKSDDNVK